MNRVRVHMVLIGFVMSLSALGCSAWDTIEKDGHEVMQGDYEWMVSQVAEPARFDMDCDQIDIKILVVDEGLIRTVGVEGCGQKRMFMRVFSTGQWVPVTEKEE